MNNVDPSVDPSVDSSVDPAVTVIVPVIASVLPFELLRSLEETIRCSGGRAPNRLHLVDAGRPLGEGRANLQVLRSMTEVSVLSCPGGSCAAARNAGWRASPDEWQVFLDEDMLLAPLWWDELRAELASCEHDVGAIGGLTYVMADERTRLRDFVQSTADLAEYGALSADVAVRRASLLAVDGFEESGTQMFDHNRRLACRLEQAGWQVQRGTRTAYRPARVKRRHGFRGPSGLGGSAGPRPVALTPRRAAALRAVMLPGVVSRLVGMALR